MNKYVVYKEGEIVSNGEYNTQSDESVKAMFDHAKRFAPCVFISTTPDGVDTPFTIEKPRN